MQVSASPDVRALDRGFNHRRMQAFGEQLPLALGRSLVLKGAVAALDEDLVGDTHREAPLTYKVNVRVQESSRR